MLQLDHIRKSYTVADFTQVALDDVSIAFRDNEFVSILGPSGSGKTTLLNIVGGLDHYDKGDLVIDGVSTTKYRDRDWDTYRNNRIGFVFQSYNLIPHQTVLANVELALTLSGVSRSERHQKALAALDQVGLAEHARKKPSQLSGGQMQRVAIARALINDPEIVLADEPTGALDSTTSVAIMNLLTEIARDRLVVMVTHNPELAEQYSTRVVELRDGAIERDSDPYRPQTELTRAAKSARKTSMSFLTALALSFKNLMTKKGRTLMTSFAGSIGIIGIAAILALASGVNAYIQNVEEDTLSVYPLTIQSQGMDLTSLMVDQAATDQDDAEDGSGDGTHGGSDASGTISEASTLGAMFSSVGSNDLASLKSYLDSGGDGINEYANSIEYSYDVTPQIFQSDTKDGARQVNPDDSFASLGIGGGSSQSSLFSSFTDTSVFGQMPSDTSLIEGQYDVVSGAWPTDQDEVVVVLMPGGDVSDQMLYAMGLRDGKELDTMVSELAEGKDVDAPAPSGSYTTQELMDTTFKVVNASDYYTFDDDYDVWTDTSGNEDTLKKLVDGGEELHVSGIVAPKEGATATALGSGIYYTPALTEHLIDEASQSEIVKQQIAHPDVDVFTGKTFAEEAADPGADDDVDLSKLITIDESALTDAFTFDESKLQLDASALDLSGLDLSGMELTGLDLSGVDLSDIQLDPSSLPEFDISQVASQVDMSELLKGIDLQQVLSGIDYQDVLSGAFEDVDQEAVAEVAQAIGEGYVAYCTAAGEGSDGGGSDGSADEANPCADDPEGSFQAFLDSDEGKQILADSQGTIDDVTGAADDAGSQLSEQLLTRLGEAVQEQVAANSGEIGSQIQQYMETYMQQAAQGYMQDLSDQVGTQIAEQIQEQMGQLMDQIGSQLTDALEEQITGAMGSAMDQLAGNMSDAMGVDEDAFADAFQFNMDEDQLSELLTSLLNTEVASLDGNYATLGYADVAKPYQIDIYPKDFESKGHIIDILDSYNERMQDEDPDKVIVYTDLVGTLMSSVTDIVNVVSYVLTAFVAISLVVSSIMIGVITYISVLERKKEIGILRALGASKRDIRRVFNAETLIVGLVAGLIGIGVTLLLQIPANLIVEDRFGIANVAQLPPVAAGVLVIISMVLTFIAGLIPSSAASRKDAVEALRSE